MHQTMQGFTDKFGKQLKSFKTTRKLLIHQHPEEIERNPNELPEAERALRQDFAWQQRLTEALLKYADAVSMALLNVGCAHEGLVNAGAADAGVDTLVLEALLQSLLEAHRICSGVATRTQRPLEAHSAALADCGKHVREADLSAAELRHYREKLDGLKEDKKTAIKKAREAGQEKFAAVWEHDAVKRNQAKLKQAEEESAAADARAKKAMDHVASQREGLCQITRNTFGDVCQAFQCMARPLSFLSNAAGEAGPASKAADMLGNDSAEATNPFSTNPFSEFAEATSPSGGGGAASAAASSLSQPQLVRCITPSYATALLGSSKLLRSMCDKYFRKFDTNGNGVLEMKEAMKLMEDLQVSLGVPPADWPSEKQLHESLAKYADEGCVLRREGFPQWFASTLEAALAKVRESGAKDQPLPSAADTA